jgi:hypothetical protein
MSRARTLGQLLDSDGDVKSTHLDNVPASDDASALTSGTLPAGRISSIASSKLTGTIADARFPATLPAISATNLTSIPAANITGTLPAISGANLTGVAPTKGTIEALSIELPATDLTGTIAAARLSTATTQSASNNSTKIATTAYADAQVATVVDSAPSTLDTLNELAEALGDDANFSTTVTTSIGTKLPKAGGEMSGNITMASTETVDGRDLSVDGAKLDLIEASADVTDTTNVVDALTAGDKITIANDGTVSFTITEFPFYKADGNVDNITITNGEFPFYKADGNQDNIGVT